MDDSRIPEEVNRSKSVVPRNKDTALAWKQQGFALIDQGRVREGRELLTQARSLFKELFDTGRYSSDTEKLELWNDFTGLTVYAGTSYALSRYCGAAIGINKETNEKISVSPDDLYSGTLIVGVTGSGKTSIMTNIALERIGIGEGVIVLDPSGSMVRDIIARLPKSAIERTYYLTVKEDKNLYSKHPFSLNLFSYPNPGSVGVAAKQAARNQITRAFSKLFPSTTEGVYFNEILRNITPILLDHPTFTLHQVEDFLLDARYRQTILKAIDNSRTLRYWQRFNAEKPQDQKEVVRPFLRRLGELLDDDFLPYHIGQKRGLLDIRQSIIDKEILLIDLPLDQMAYREAAKALGTLLMMQIYAATFSLLDYKGERPSFTLLVDEFAKWVYNSGDEFNDLLQYGRKYGIRQVLGTQFTGQLEEEGLPKSLKDGITGAKTIISLRTTLQDRKVLAPLFASIGNKQLNLYREPIKHLEDPMNPPFIKEFYWQVIRPLEFGANGKGRTELDKVVGTHIYDFGFGEVEFFTETVKTLLDLLNELFYSSQLNKQIDEERLKEIVYEYMLLNDFVRITAKSVIYDHSRTLDGNKYPIKGYKEDLHYSKVVTNRYKERRKEARQLEDNDSHQFREVIDKDAQKRFDTMFRTICTMLIQNPIVIPAPDQTEEEMANKLHQLPDREGFAKVGSSVYEIRTIDLPKKHAEEKITARWNTIIKQTKAKYAQKGRTEIRNDIMSSFIEPDNLGQRDRLDEFDSRTDY